MEKDQQAQEELNDLQTKEADQKKLVKEDPAQIDPPTPILEGR